MDEELRYADDLIYDEGAQNLQDENADDENEYEEKQREKLTRKERKKRIKADRKREKKIEQLQRKDKRHKTKEKAQEKLVSFGKRQKNEIENFRFTPLRVVIIVIFLIIVTIAVMLFINRDMISLDNFKNYMEYGIFNKDKEERFPEAIQGSMIQAGNFDRMGSYLCYTSDTNFYVLNCYGATTLSTQISYTNPVLYCCDERSIVYSLGDKGFQISSKDEVIYTGEAENNILTACVNNKGMYALVEEYDGYLSKLFIFDENNEQIYAYSFADFYITSVSINEDGHRAALTGITALDGKELSAVYVLDITKQEPVFFQKVEDTFMYKVSLFGDNHGCAIGNHSCVGFKVSSGEMNLTLYEGKTLTAYTVNRTNNTFNISLSRSGDGRNCDILTFDQIGIEIGRNETSLPVTSVSAFKGNIAALAESEIYLFSRDGYQKSVRNAGLDPHVVILYTRKDAFVLGVADIIRISL